MNRHNAATNHPESDDLFRMITDQGQALIWAAGIDKGCFYFNKPWLAFTGRTLEQEFGDGWASGVHPDDLQHCLNIYGTAFDRRDKFSSTYRLRRHDGEYRWILDEGVPRFDRHGNFLGYIGHCLDITERKQAEDLSNEAQERLLALLDSLDAIVYVADMNTYELLFVNQYVKNVFGNIVGQLCWKTLQVRQSGPCAFCTNNKLFDDNGNPAEVYHWEFQNTANDRWYDIRDKAITWVDNRIVRLEIATDITKRKQLEETLKVREIELSTIIETEPECVNQLAADGTLLQMNRAGLNMIEAESIDQVRGQKVAQLVMPEYRDAFMSLTARVFAGESGSMTFEIQGLKGSNRWLETHAVPLRNAQGQVISLLGVTRDITERKKMEEEIRYLAFYDPLTELPNRRLVYDRLSQVMSSTKRSGCYSAVIFLDLDNFKPLNDTYGHEAGDLLLIEVANRLRGCVRETDTVGRFGGDEFVVILSELNSNKDTSTTQAKMVAEIILTTLSEPYRLTIHQEGKADTTIEHICTTSIGINLFMGHVVSQSDILKRADSAMYQVKAAGRNKILIF